MNKNIIEINKLYKNFKSINSTIKVLNDINLKLESGKLIALMGPSGSGKSTFLHLLALLDKPSKGKIRLLGKDTDDISEDQKNLIIRNNISIIFQNNNLLSDFNSLENVAIPLIIRGNSYNFSIKKAAKILSKVNLDHRLEHFPNDLSGGEQQRVAIARSLISETDLILADEPTGNLDFKTSKEIFNYFIKLKKMKKTILFATHNRELANRADYKLSIFNGNIKRINGKK
jgi:lipoprotein-releasing system ATP-binding protein